jgi:hypothetical protein
MRQLAVQFAKGDRHARRDTFWIAEQLGSDFLKPEKTAEVGLSPDYQAILDAYVARTARPAGSHRRAGVGAITGFY